MVRHIATIAFVAAISLSGGESSWAISPTSSLPGVQCYRVALQERPKWISDAAWIPKTSQLLIVDPFSSKVFSFTPMGTRGSSSWADRPGGVNTLELPPLKISNNGDTSILVEKSDGTIAQLDDDLRVVRNEVRLEGKRAGEYRVGSMYQWVATGDSLFAYGALLRNKDDNLTFGFFRVPLDGYSSAQVTLLKEFDSKSFYLLTGYQYLTAVGNDVYFVLMDKQPTIFKVNNVTQTIEKFPAFPKTFKSPYRLPEFQTQMTGPKSAPAHFAELEKFTMPAGLFSQNGMLFLLTRNPSTQGGTDWWLYKINPEEHRILGRVLLPTKTNHVTLVPSEQAWFVLERGAVRPGQKVQQQSIDTMLVLPSAGINSLLLPLTCPTNKN